MRQILVNSQGALVARMPRPALAPGHVLVRVRYSLISTGTELAPLRHAASPDASGVERASARAHVASRYLGKAIRDPRKAASRLASIARQRMQALRPPAAPATSVALRLAEVQWTQANATALDVAPGGVTIVTDASDASYQALGQPVTVPPGMVPVVVLHGAVTEGRVAVGLLDDTGSRWLGTRQFDAGEIDDRLVVDPAGSSRVTLVVTAAGAGRPSTLRLDRLEILMTGPTEDGLPLSELDAQGWNVGYSAAGEVVAVGEGVETFAPGDRVACAGAGQANHADFVSVPRNLVCRVPEGCRLEWAASTTVGTIALQGVRRAAPALGERVAVLGLGLIGQLTVQLLRAAGCTVIGLDLDAAPGRARHGGPASTTAPPTPTRSSAWCATAPAGRARTARSSTAATKSDAVINLAMDVTRRRGAVVIVGDVGCASSGRRSTQGDRPADEHVVRARPLRPQLRGGGPRLSLRLRALDAESQHAGLPRAAASGRLAVDALIDRIVPVDEAPSAYGELAAAGGAPPLGVLIANPDDTRELPEPADAPRIRSAAIAARRTGPVEYALVGAGAFGTSMLVPQMKRRADASSCAAS